ncbi:hypothetical protein [Micromonospora sp. SH-82]
MGVSYVGRRGKDGRRGERLVVLFKVYAKCLDGDRSRMNERIEAALS